MLGHHKYTLLSVCEMRDKPTLWFTNSRKTDNTRTRQLINLQTHQLTNLQIQRPISSKTHTLKLLLLFYNAVLVLASF